MTNDAPERFTTYNVMMSAESGREIPTPNGKWVRYEDYKAAVDAAYEDAAEVVWHECYPSTNQGALSEIQLAEADTTEIAIKAIRARADTDALAARDARVKAEALREAAVNLKTYAPHLEDGPEHDVGYYHGYQTALNRILALIPADQEGGGW